jgi:sensor histidine kinase regulating citrate/malate metabolism
VRNDTIIPENVKMQLFQRSFSTKGQGRGIGTYSIKLLTENYLKGKVSFISNETERTVFSVVLNKIFPADIADQH